jgi:hypothetical protein
MSEVSQEKWGPPRSLLFSSSSKARSAKSPKTITSYNAITSDLPYQGAISAYLLRSARATHV